MQYDKTPNKAVVAVIVVVLLAAVSAGTIYLIDSQADIATETASTPVAKESNVDSVTSGTYSAGTYTATGRYSSPGGTESVTVSVTVNTDGEISNTSTTSGADNPTSRQYQSEFINNYKDLVIGKKIDEVELSRVAGSSLTSGGFNEALEQIKQDATT